MDREGKTAECEQDRELEMLVREFFQKKSPAIADRLPPGVRPSLTVRSCGFTRFH
ncbi:MAG: hypothetical protein IJG57_01395 [Firmicutes bacterium]|jgi:hypothetical protein|nr:hypothetical protein [Bacillota bacterium]